MLVLVAAGFEFERRPIFARVGLPAFDAEIVGDDAPAEIVDKYGLRPV
jgi:hypothetical protein